MEEELRRTPSPDGKTMGRRISQESSNSPELPTTPGLPSDQTSTPDTPLSRIPTAFNTPDLSNGQASTPDSPLSWTATVFNTRDADSEDIVSTPTPVDPVHVTETELLDDTTETEIPKSGHGEVELTEEVPIMLDLASIQIENHDHGSHAGQYEGHNELSSLNLNKDLPPIPEANPFKSDEEESFLPDQDGSVCSTCPTALPSPTTASPTTAGSDTKGKSRERLMFRTVRDLEAVGLEQTIPPRKPNPTTVALSGPQDVYRDLAMYLKPHEQEMLDQEQTNPPSSPSPLVTVTDPQGQTWEQPLLPTHHDYEMMGQEQTIPPSYPSPLVTVSNPQGQSWEQRLFPTHRDLEMARHEQTIPPPNISHTATATAPNDQSQAQTTYPLPRNLEQERHIPRSHHSPSASARAPKDQFQERPMYPLHRDLEALRIEDTIPSSERAPWEPPLPLGPDPRKRKLSLQPAFDEGSSPVVANLGDKRKRSPGDELTDLRLKGLKLAGMDRKEDAAVSGQKPVPRPILRPPKSTDGPCESESAGSQAVTEGSNPAHDSLNVDNGTQSAAHRTQPTATKHVSFLEVEDLESGACRPLDSCLGAIGRWFKVLGMLVVASLMTPWGVCFGCCGKDCGGLGAF